MTRVSAFRGTWTPNARPFVSLTPDVYVAIQGETNVIACGECSRKIDLNRYITAVNTEADVDSPAQGSATITLSVPDTDVNEFYVDGRLVIMSMMEVEVFAKGYYNIGGVPQYYRTFWGLVSSVTKSWSNGVTTINLACRDILRWWELTNFNNNPAFLDASKSQSGLQLFGNFFANMNPYTVMITLARDAMGDFSITDGSFLAYRPEYGAEQPVTAQYAKDIMAYWQLKFGNIWNSLVMYGTSGQAYSFSGLSGNVSPLQISQQLFEQEARNLSANPATALFKVNPFQNVVWKQELSKAAQINFFQTESQTKLEIAVTARDQAGGFEFYCDPTGDIVFKPPFYNMNTLPNKPVSWIQDFEIMDDSISDNEQDVYTHVTSHGDAFSNGSMDYGLNSDITTPRTGVIDFHLLKRYGWRRLDVQVNWAADAKKLFFHLLDQIDKINSKRESGTITIPMRPELKIGFPVWIPRYDAFFYVSSISHGFSVGGQATSTLTLKAKRQKFIAPKNIGTIKSTSEKTYSVSFPSDVGQTTSLTETGQTADYGGPMVLRNPKTGALLGYPNAVMVYRQTLDGVTLQRVLQQSGSTKGAKPKTQDKQKPSGPNFSYNQISGNLLADLASSRRAEIVDRLRLNRYEAGMTNAGVYDYAHDASGNFLEFAVVPADKITWDSKDSSPEGDAAVGNKERQESLASDLKDLQGQRTAAIAAAKAAKAASLTADQALAAFSKKNPPQGNELSAAASQLTNQVTLLKEAAAAAAANLTNIQNQIKVKTAESQSIRKLTPISIMIRPVSDEFGFEVIGHYRYGRGTFIDRGQVQLPNPDERNANPSTSVNKLDIQFAPVGGLLTDNPVQGNLGPQSANYGEMFERMSPDDYVTGASFKGSNYAPDATVQQLSLVGQSTYTDSINNARTKAGVAVFAEADAVRRAQTLAELSPTVKGGLSTVGYNDCTCVLGKTTWLSILPLNIVRQLLGPVLSTPAGISGDAATALSEGAPSEGEIASSGISGVVGAKAVSEADSQLLTNAVVGNGFTLDSPGGFFNVLNKFLTDKFTRDYDSNAQRESYDKNGGKTVVRPNEGTESDNLVSDPQSALFGRAAQGDPAALRSLQGQANFNFGRTKQADAEFNASFTNAKQQLGSAISDLPGSIWDSSKGGLVNAGTVGISGTSVGSGPSRGPQPGVQPQFQPPGVSPKIGQTINPGQPPDLRVR
jgi:hypothetical protein